MTQVVAPLLTAAEVCEIFGGEFTEAHLGQLRYTGKGPKFVELTGRQVRYRPSDVAEWLESHTRSRTEGGDAG